MRRAALMPPAPPRPLLWWAGAGDGEGCGCPSFGGGVNRAERWSGASQVAAAFLLGIPGPQEGLQRQIAISFGL